jgi:hypothetical protein
VHLPRRTAVTVCAVALTGALAGCSDSPVAAEPEVTAPGGVAPGGEDKDAPDGGEVTPPSSP